MQQWEVAFERGGISRSPLAEQQQQQYILEPIFFNILALAMLWAGPGEVKLCDAG
jgi:hypothetical protein